MTAPTIQMLPPEGHERTGGTRGQIRTDIQALRALAVVLVVVFHLWPDQLSGGYVGVDVFFVVSGFLITGHILREVALDGRVRLGTFWARRARRLLPASLLVCAVSIIATWAWAPRALWSQFFKEIVASVLYVQNWVLAGDSVDYLAAENAPSPVQHFWSLAIEEQFYLVWPVMIAIAVALAGRIGRSTVRSTAIVIASVCAIGFVVSVWWTWAAPASAYFATPTRIWEFGAGGLLAINVGSGSSGSSWSPSTRVRHTATVAGLTMIVVSAVVYGSTTAFPGWTAIVPVLGTLLVVGAGPGGTPNGLSIVTDNAVTQWIGDVSYSLYLWHWPVIVFAPFVLDGDLRFREELALLAISFLLAGASKYFVEDRFRRAPRLAARAARTYAAALVGMAVIGGVGVVAMRSANNEAAAAVEAADEAIADTRVCYGAEALLSPAEECEAPATDELLPRPVALKKDTGGGYSCYEGEQVQVYEVCNYGSAAPDAVRVAVVGDSHAAALLPGLWTQLEDANWSLDSFVGRGCVWMAVVEDDRCATRQLAAQELFEQGDPYDVIIVTTSRNERVAAGDVDPRSERFARAWAPVIERGTLVVAVTDNPLLPDATVECLDAIEVVGDADACTMSRDVAMKFSDAMPRAVELAGDGAFLIETDRAFCTDGRCPLVIGNVIVYRDRHHMTATYSKTLAPYIVEDITDLLEASS